MARHQVELEVPGGVGKQEDLDELLKILENELDDIYKIHSKREKDVTISNVVIQYETNYDPDRKT